MENQPALITFTLPNDQEISLKVTKEDDLSLLVDDFCDTYNLEPEINLAIKSELAAQLYEIEQTRREEANSRAPEELKWIDRSHDILTQQTPLGFNTDSSPTSFEEPYRSKVKNAEAADISPYGLRGSEKERNLPPLSSRSRPLDSKSSRSRSIRGDHQNMGKAMPRPSKKDSRTDSYYRIHQGNSWQVSSSIPSLQELDEQIQDEISQIGALKKKKFEEALLKQDLEDENLHHTIFGLDMESSEQSSNNLKSLSRKLQNSKQQQSKQQRLLQVSPSTIGKADQGELEPEEERDLAKLYENLQEEKINASPQKKLKSKKYGHIKSRVFDTFSSKNVKQFEKGKIDEPVDKSPSKFKSKPSKKDKKLKRAKNNQMKKGESVEDRLIKFGKDKKRKYKNLKELNEKLREEAILKEIRLKPEICERSSSIVKKMNRGHFSNPFERLFFKGIEQSKKKEEKAEEMFKENYPFVPQTKSSDDSKLFQKKVDFDKLHRGDQDHQTKMNLLRYFHQNFDMKTGQPLYKPVISKFDKKDLEGPSWVQIEEARRWSKELRQKCMIIFKFLDPSHSGFISAKSIDYRRMHGNCVNILSDLLVRIIECPYQLNFIEFYQFVLEEDLVDLVEAIFAVIQSQPEVIPAFKV